MPPWLLCHKPSRIPAILKLVPKCAALFGRRGCAPETTVERKQHQFWAMNRLSRPEQKIVPKKCGQQNKPRLGIRCDCLFSHLDLPGIHTRHTRLLFGTYSEHWTRQAPRQRSDDLGRLFVQNQYGQGEINMQNSSKMRVHVYIICCTQN